jgi:hypothetical protein
MSIEKFIQHATRNDENTVTAFLFSLMDVAYMRTIILRALLPDDIPYTIVEGIDFSHITTQKRIEEVGQPDIWVENDECFFIIEIKIANSTGFQSSQLTAYPEKVHEKAQKYKGLIYLLPDSYRYERQPGEDESLTFVTRWSSLIRKIELSDIESDNPIVYQFLKYLRNRLSLTSTASFTRGDIITMFSPKKVREVLEFQEKWKSFIIDVDYYLANDQDLTEIYVQSTWSDYKLGTYASNRKKADVFWFGYDYRISFEDTNTFCCVAKSLVDEKHQEKEPLGEQEVYVVVTIDSLKMNGYLHPDDREWVYFPIDSAFLYSDKIDDNVGPFAGAVKKLVLEFSK